MTHLTKSARDALRDAMNELDAYIDDYDNSISSGDVFTQTMHDTYLKVFRTMIEVVMAERGISPREDGE